jgi:hypothetical protein
MLARRAGREATVAECKLTPEQQEITAELFQCAAASAELAKKTDAEIAELLENNVWAHMSILEVSSEVVSQAIGRLSA